MVGTIELANDRGGVTFVEAARGRVIIGGAGYAGRGTEPASGGGGETVAGVRVGIQGWRGSVLSVQAMPTASRCGATVGFAGKVAVNRSYGRSCSNLYGQIRGLGANRCNTRGGSWRTVTAPGNPGREWGRIAIGRTTA